MTRADHFDRVLSIEQRVSMADRVFEEFQYVGVYKGWRLKRGENVYDFIVYILTDEQYEHYTTLMGLAQLVGA